MSTYIPSRRKWTFSLATVSYAKMYAISPHNLLEEDLYSKSSIYVLCHISQSLSSTLFRYEVSLVSETTCLSRGLMKRSTKVCLDCIQDCLVLQIIEADTVYSDINLSSFTTVQLDETTLAVVN